MFDQFLKIRKLLVLLMIYFSLLINSYGESLDWQKIHFEENLISKINQKLSYILPDKKFIVSVIAELKSIEKKEIFNSSEEAVTIDKIDLDVPILKIEEFINLFENIKKITVKVFVDQNSIEKKEDLLKQIVLGALGKINDVEIDVSIDKVDLSSSKNETEIQWGFRRWIIEFKEQVGVLVTTMTILVFLLLLFAIIFNIYKKIEFRKIAILEAKDAREEAIHQSQNSEKESEIFVKDSASLKENVIVSDFHLEGSEKGLSRFKKILSDSPAEAAHLVKEWIRDPKKGASECLTVLSQILSPDDIEHLFQSMSLSDRRGWKTLLLPKLDENLVKVADVFMSSQIIDHILVPQIGVDEETKSMLGDLKTSELVEMTNQSPASGALLFNVLPTVQVSRMIALMPFETVAQVTSESLKQTEDVIKNEIPKLKNTINNLRSSSRSKGKIPFLSRAAELLKEVGPEKEVTIFTALIDSGEFDLLRSTVNQFIPAEIVFQLPKEIIKNVLSLFPQSKRSEMIISFNQEDQLLVLNAMGNAGTKVRELYDLEMKEIRSDESRMRRIQRNKSNLWFQFVDATRKLIRSNPVVGELANEVVQDWLENKIGNSNELSNEN